MRRRAFLASAIGAVAGLLTGRVETKWRRSIRVWESDGNPEIDSIQVLVFEAEHFELTEPLEPVFMDYDGKIKPVPRTG